jgi:CubicO group peptidase (beta-lactamase class C family)
MRVTPGLASVLAVAMVVACDAAAADDGAGVVVAGEKGAEIDRYLTACETFGFSGSVLVTKGGQVLVRKGYGLADREHGTANTPATLFEIASASKQFTAAAVLKLESLGKLSLDDSIAKHLPGVPDEHRGVTVRHLLNHTSGFPRMGPSGGGPDLAGAAAGYLKGRRTAEPGARFEYWNGGYALLAGIVERVSGQPFTEFCRKNLFEPAGLSSTGFCGDTTFDAGRLAHGYEGDKDAGAANTHSFGWEYRGMGGVVTSVADLGRWDRALRGDAVLPEKSRKLLFAPALSDYACGWSVVKQPAGLVAEHGGTVAGFENEMIRCLEQDTSVYLLANRRDVGWQVGYEVAGMLLGDGFPLGSSGRAPMPPATVDVPRGRLGRIAGRYALPSGGALVVRAQGRGLVVGAEGQTALDVLAGRVPDAERFRAERDVAARIVAGVSKGDVSLLKEKVVDAFWSKTWPDQVRDSIWPEHVAKWGALKSMEEIGAQAEGGRSSARVFVRLRHEKGDATAEIVLAGGRVSILDLAGREFPVRATYLPASDAKLVSYDFGRPAPPPIEFAVGGDRADDELRIQPPTVSSPIAARRAPGDAR